MASFKKLNPNSLEERFPATAAWIQHGWIDIDDQEFTRTLALTDDQEPIRNPRGNCG